VADSVKSLIRLGFRVVHGRRPARCATAGSG